MSIKSSMLVMAVLSYLLCSNLALAASASAITADELGQQWAQASFGVSEESSKKRLKSSVRLAETAVTYNSENPNILAWAGVIEASYAGVLSGMSALRHAKKARKLLSAAMERDPEALNGGARSTLGVLYYKVPRWPIGFGNKRQAETLLSESASKYPSSLNAQYFYAEYLYNRNRKSEAREVFERALSLPVRPDYQQVDAARLIEIKKYLTEL